MSGYIELSNGVRIPSIGFGTWQTPDGKTAEHAVSFALRNGYSHIDAAAIYGNEKGVGAGIRASGVPRERILAQSLFLCDASFLTYSLLLASMILRKKYSSSG